MFRAGMMTILFFLLGLTSASLAAVSLSVNPVDGSSSLRFDRTPAVGGVNKQEIRIRVTSPNGERYQVFQRMIEPITNEKGETLNLQAMETQTLFNSNSSGTLYLQNSDHLSMGDQLLYSSSEGGASDSFVIGYSLNQDLVNNSGSFRGRLVFTVRGTGNDAGDQVTIDVFLKTSSTLKVSVKGTHNPNEVKIHDADTSGKTADYVILSFSGNGSQEIRIYQEIESFPQNEVGQDLGMGALAIEAQGGSEGVHIQGPTSIGRARQLIYSSNKDEDSFNIYFLANADQGQQQDAGSYVGKIKYVVETDHGRQEFPMDLKYEISPVFTMNVKAPPGGVSYSHVLANSPPQEKQVLVMVRSNLHKPYQVTQGLQTGMTNQEGKVFENKYFTFQVAIPADQKGQTNFTEFSSVQTGEYPVFSSDARGSGATFAVVYRLQGYPGMSAGDFTAPVRFSLDQK